MSSSDRTSAPFVGAESKFRITFGAFLGIIMTIIAGATAWTWVKADVQKNTSAISVHDRRLDTVEAKIATDHDILLEIRGDVKLLGRERQAK